MDNMSKSTSIHLSPRNSKPQKGAGETPAPQTKAAECVQDKARAAAE